MTHDPRCVYLYPSSNFWGSPDIIFKLLVIVVVPLRDIQLGHCFNHSSPPQTIPKTQPQSLRVFQSFDMSNAHLMLAHFFLQCLSKIFAIQLSIFCILFPSSDPWYWFIRRITSTISINHTFVPMPGGNRCGRHFQCTTALDTSGWSPFAPIAIYF